MNVFIPSTISLIKKLNSIIIEINNFKMFITCSKINKQIPGYVTFCSSINFNIILIVFFFNS